MESCKDDLGGIHPLVFLKVFPASLQVEDPCQPVLPDSVGKEAVIPYFLESFRKDMEQEPLDELFRCHAVKAG